MWHNYDMVLMQQIDHLVVEGSMVLWHIVDVDGNPHHSKSKKIQTTWEDYFPTWECYVILHGNIKF